MRLIQVLGPGCDQCRQLAENAEAAVAELGIQAAVEKVTDIDRIIELGALMTPALVVDGDILWVGKVASVAEIKRLLCQQA
ncbi:MAG TPA: thioredoxin family protein [Planctomycetaceae bacterium]|nr:thioredoxin family protein [Planctomycetaceae bacterium]HIQ20075.1 thioredoxin family protein [Planctomycetota bacterium]